MDGDTILAVDDILRRFGEPSMTNQEISSVDDKGMPTSTDQELFDIAVYVVQLRGTLNASYDKISLYASDNGLSFSATKVSKNNIFIGADLGEV